MFRLLTTFLISFLFVVTAQAGPSLYGLNGERISFASLSGKWVLINYWASWCGPCVDEINELNRFYQRNKHKNIELFAVNYDMVSEPKLKKLIKRFNIQYKSLKKDPAQQLNLGQIKGVPATFVFNPKGQLTKVLYGEQTVGSLCRVTLARNC